MFALFALPRSFPFDALAELGQPDQIRKAYVEFQRYLYLPEARHLAVCSERSVGED